MVHAVLLGPGESTVSGVLHIVYIEYYLYMYVKLYVCTQTSIHLHSSDGPVAWPRNLVVSVYNFFHFSIYLDV